MFFLKIPLEVKMSLFHIAGYVTRKDPPLEEEDLLENTNFYSVKYGQYTSNLDRGLLKIPHDRACQWVFFSYVMFSVVKEKVCRSSLCSIFMEISDHFQFNMKKSHGTALANIFLKQLCKSVTPRDGKESKQKVIKLSV